MTAQLHKLEPHQYSLVHPLFEDLRYNLVVDSIVAGYTPAWVYADDTHHPRTAIVWNRQDALLLAGDARDPAVNAALGRWITEEVLPDARSRHIPELALFYAPPAWEDKVDVVLHGLQPELTMRRFYQFEAPRLDWRARLPPGYEMRPIDVALLDRTDLQNLQSLAGWVYSFWPSAQHFANAGFGFCLLHGDIVTSWCLSVYVAGTDFELGVATVPAYRKQGLATLVTAASVAHCARQGWTPHWHCWEDNLPSSAVAEKVGFVRPARYAVYRFETQGASL